MHRIVPLAVVVLLALVAPLAAAPLNKADVPADAKWVVHADVEGFLASKVGSAILEEARKQNLDNVLAAIQVMFSFDPTKDLKGVTVFGCDYREGVVLIHAKLDREKVVTILKANDTLKEGKYGEHVVYSWVEKAKKEKEDGGEEKSGRDEKAASGEKKEKAEGAARFGCFAGEDIALIAQDQAALRHAIDVLDKKADSLAKEGVAGPLPAAIKGAWLTAGLTELASATKQKADAPVPELLKKFAAAAGQIGEADDKVFVKLAVTAADDETAANLRKIAEGVLAVADLLSTVQNDGKPALPPELAASLKAATVAVKDRTVSLDVAFPVKDAVSGIKKAMEQQRLKVTDASSTSAEFKIEFKSSPTSKP